MGERRMTALEGCLIVIGIIAIVISYFISEKNSEERMKKAVDELVLGEETKKTLIRQAKDTVEEALNGMSEEIAGKAEIQLEKLSNEKIMMVHEYSDTVLEEIGKNHQEVMFLYSMLDEKDRDVKNTVREAQKTVKSIRELNQMQEYIIRQSEGLAEEDLEYREMKQGFERNIEEDFKENLEKRRIERPEKGTGKGSEHRRKKRSRKKNQEKRGETTEAVQNEEEYIFENVNEEYLVEIEEKEEYLDKSEEKRNRIIRLYQQGNSKLEIAKELKLSMGEVNLIIDLHDTSKKRRGNME